MDFELIEEQRILQRTAQEFLKKECPKELVRSLDESEEGYSLELWNKMAELGWMGLILPEAYGGSEWSFLDMVILLEEMGYNICPGPFFSTTVLGGLTVLRAGNEAQKKEILPKVSSGDLILTLAMNEAEGGLEPVGIQTRAEKQGDAYVLDGIKLFVPDGHLAHKLLIVARTSDNKDPAQGLTIFLADTGIDGMTINQLKSIARDKQCEVVLDGVRLPEGCILGTVDQGFAIISEIMRYAAVARAAEMIGGARAAMDLAMSYAHERTQFGRPIGTFQAMQHYLADMWVEIYGARNLIYKAAWKLSEGQSAEMEAAMAKGRAGLVSRKATITAHRIFGAISFTMEHDLHLYTRRALAGDMAQGDADFQHESVARSLGL
jgi:alkylation response protein AidB-like acyl-CoA dehydrogenase